MSMGDTLQQVLCPFFIMCFIMGLGFYPKKQLNIRWIAKLNILYSVTKWLVYIYLLLHTLTNIGEKILFHSANVAIVEKTNFLLSIISAITSFYYQKRFEISIKKLASVDNTLEKLGTPKMYEKLHAKSKQIIISWIVYSLSMNIVDTIWWLRIKNFASWAIFIIYILNHCIHVNTLVDILFTFFLWLV
ncbi:PREDICTED: uncharacterized protein LOC105562313 [Vollenhovia emeryi]|uniref:uncharacterized protein LOC105562313 n=1 Tax=Vollenhovia emeryi TaxID=411798 RepID=UPI0005F3E141|nr:PREDICTED: uncharacterized protein LOC105562313 [Vollenhovia emeryi]